jgi:hypothetical protein
MKFFEAIKVYGDPKAITNWLSAFSEGGSAIGEKRIVPVPSKPSDPDEYQILCNDLRTSIVRKGKGTMSDFASPRAALQSFLAAWRAGAVIAYVVPFAGANGEQKRAIEAVEIDFIEDVVVPRSLFTIAGRECFLDFSDGPALTDPIGIVFGDAAAGANGGQRSTAGLDLREQGALAGRRKNAANWVLTEGRERHNLRLLTKGELITLLMKECDLPTKNAAKEVLNAARQDERWDPAWSKPGPRKK